MIMRHKTPKAHIRHPLQNGLETGCFERTRLSNHRRTLVGPCATVVVS